MGIYDDLAKLENSSPTPKKEAKSQKAKADPPPSSQTLSKAATATKSSKPSEKQPHERKSKHVNKKTSKQVNMFTNKQVYVDKFLRTKAIMTASFRLPPEIVEKFNETYYSAKGEYKADFKRYSMIVAALAIFIWDYEQNGKDSDLYQLLVKTKK